jgi:hypothetical protein
MARPLVYEVRDRKTGADGLGYPSVGLFFAYGFKSVPSGKRPPVWVEILLGTRPAS